MKQKNTETNVDLQLTDMYVYMMLIYDVPRLSLNILRKAIFIIVKSIAGLVRPYSKEAIDFFGALTELFYKKIHFMILVHICLSGSF